MSSWRELISPKPPRENVRSESTAHEDKQSPENVPVVLVQLQDQIQAISQILQDLESVSEEKITRRQRQEIEAKLTQIGLAEVQLEKGTRAELAHQLKKLRHELILESRVAHKDLAFLAKERGQQNEASPEVHEIMSSSNPTRYYELILENLLATHTAKTPETEQLEPRTETPEKISEFISQILELASLLEDPQFRNRAEIKKQIALCRISVGSDHIVLKNLLGGAAFDALMTELDRPGRSPHTLESLENWKTKFRQAILSSRVTTGIFFLLLNQEAPGEKRSQKTETDELTNFLDQHFFEDFDEFIKIASFLSESELKFSASVSSKQSTQASAAFLHNEAAYGKISSTFAREIFFDAQRQGSDALMTAYLDAFTEQISSILAAKSATQETGERGKRGTKNTEALTEKRKKVIKVLALFFLLSSLGLAAASQPKMIAQLNQVLQTMSASIGELPREIGHMLENELGIKIPGIDDAPTNTSVADTMAPEQQITENQFTPEELTQVLNEVAKSQEIASTKPITSTDLTTPSSDGVRNNFSPGSADLEGTASEARILLWEMQNWDPANFPDFLSTGTYTQIDPKTGQFSRWEPSQEAVGTMLPAYDYNHRSELRNLVTGTRTEVDHRWFQVPHPQGKRVDGGGIWVILDGVKVGDYLFEWTQSPNSFDQFVRPDVDGEDWAWIAERAGHVQLQEYFTYRDYNETDLKPHFSESKDNILTASDLPANFQKTLQDLNSNSNLSDKDKLRALQREFNNFGIYSFNPKDDQNIYVSNAIDNHLISEDERVKAFYQAFYFGADFKKLGLPANSESPQAGAGECNRRNASGKELFELLKLQGNWTFALDEGVVASPMIRGHQSHMRLVAVNVDTLEEIVLDLTGAPRTDEATAKALDAANTLVEPNSTSASSSDSGIEEPRYVAGPEVSRYPAFIPETIIPVKSLLPSSLNQKNNEFLNSATINPSGVQLPWDIEYFGLKDNTFDPILGFTGPLAPAKLDASGQISLDTRISPINPDVVRSGTGEARIVTTYSLKLTLHNTNVVPLLNGTRFQVDANSIQVRIAGFPGKVPFRLVQFTGRSFSKALVIDLPPGLLDNKKVEVTSDIPGIQMGNIREWSTPRSLKQATEQLTSLGLSESDIFRLYLNNSLTEISRLNFDRQDAQRDVNYPSSLESEKQKAEAAFQKADERFRTAVDQLLQDLRSSPLTPPKVIDLVELQKEIYLSDPANFRQEIRHVATELDTRFPTFLTDLLLSPNSEVADTGFMGYDSLANFGIQIEHDGTDFIPDLVKIVKERGHISVGEVVSEQTTFIGGLTNFLHLYITDFILPTALPYQGIHPFYDEYNTGEMEGMKSCMTMYSDQTQVYQCLLRLPKAPALAKSAISVKLFTALNDNPTEAESPFDITLYGEKKAELLEDSDSMLSSRNGSFSYNLEAMPAPNFTLDLFAPLNWEKGKSYLNPTYFTESDRDPYASNEESELKKKFPSLEERTVSFEAEKQATKVWYLQEIVHALTQGNPKVWAKLLAMITGPAAIAYGALRRRSHSKRWSTYGGSVGELLVRGRDAHHERIELTKMLAEELGVDFPSISAQELDESWSEPKGGVTAKQVLIRRLVTRTGLEGKMRIPNLKIPERLKKPENPWKSRAVPPTYSEHVLFAQGEVAGYVELLESDPEKQPAVQKVLEQVLSIGVTQASAAEMSEQKKGLPMESFKENQLILINKQAWCEEVKGELQAKLSALIGGRELVEDELAGYVDAIAADFAEVWTSIMSDWQEMNKKRQDATVFGKVRKLLNNS
jgi:hypothetical protein